MDPPNGMVHIVAHFGTMTAACVSLGTPRVIDGRSRQNRSVTSGKGLPLRVGYSPFVGRVAGCLGVRSLAAWQPSATAPATALEPLCVEQPPQN